MLDEIDNKEKITIVNQRLCDALNILEGAIEHKLEDYANMVKEITKLKAENACLKSTLKEILEKLDIITMQIDKLKKELHENN